MVPSTYEDGTLYNVLPSGNKAPDETGNHNGYDQTRADFTFSRGSNLAATRVNSDGLIEKGRENLLLQSNQFDTTWVSSNVSETSGQEGYDGSNNAWLLSISGGSSTQRVEQSVTNSGVQTFSVYVKKGTLNWVRIRVNATNVAQTYFDLENGVAGNTQSGLIDRNIESVGNGWYRCSITFNSTSSVARIYPATGDNNTTQSSGSIYIQNAQLEAGLVATDYIETGSTTAQAGILEDMPRINYDANGENGALLLEPSRTNNILNSEYFAGYSFTNGSITTNNTTSPEGLNNGSTFVESTATGTHQMRITTGVTSGSDVTFSFYAKANGRDYVNFWEDVTTGHQAYFNLSTGVATNNGFTSVGIEDAGSGWYRCYGTKSSFGGSSFGARIHASQGANFNSYAGDGESGYHIYGLQLESSASYPSSYVPTYGSAVTRSADFMSSTNDLLSGADDMAWFVEYTLEKESTSSFRNQLGYRDNANANFYMVQFPNSNTHEFRYRGVAAQNIDMTPTIDEATYGLHRKIVYLKRGTTLKVFCNGSQVSTITNAGATTFSTTDENFEVGSNYPPEMSIHQFSVFNGSISDAEAIALTTL